ncbi:ABC transporter permease [Spongiactinospora gelatinilytica]|uniref:ABC transporter permease n=1 Tax=Spongiactinospora gelatinilytica TaxID=2666298 RepID=A0A2W2HMA3_9ACTN|nr:ABC transporter permease [Spongiactinospora gelatinilytica]PZG56269.1 ABC transporter permease [Spongiactinospora gelatinilytica]
MTAISTPEPAGVIHDIGYRHYDGARLGRGHARVALTRHSLRGAFGLGRSFRAKVMPFVLLVIMLLPAIVSIAGMALAQQRGPVIDYPNFAATMSVVLAIFLATQSPVLVAPDLRFRVLPLYFSRPVTVGDYVVAKVTAMSLALLILQWLPLTVTFVGELLVNPPGDPGTGRYLASMVLSVVYSLMLACLGLAIASLTPRRGLGVAAVIAFYLFTTAVSQVLTEILGSMSQDDSAGWALLINPFYLVDAVQVWLTGASAAMGNSYPGGASGPVAALGIVALTALGGAVLILRYRKAASA